MGAVERDERSEDRSIGPGAPEGGRSPTGGDPGGAAPSGVTALEPGQRWTLARKREVVLRLLRGESIEVLSRELAIESYRLQEWYDGALAGLDCGLRERGGDPEGPLGEQPGNQPEKIQRGHKPARATRTLPA